MGEHGPLVFWGSPFLLLVVMASVRRYRRRPRPRTWFAPGVIGLLLVAECAALSIVTRDRNHVLSIRIPPLTYEESPVSEVLLDIAQHVHSRGRDVDFFLYGEALKATPVSLRTQKKTTLKRLLEGLADHVGCSFRCLTHCTGGLVFVYRGDREQRRGKLQMVITPSGVEYLGGRDGQEDQITQEATEEASSAENWD